MLSFIFSDQLPIYAPSSASFLAGYTSAPALPELDKLSWLIIWTVAAASLLLVASAIGTPKFVTFTILVAAFVGCTIFLTAINNILLFFALWELAATICWAIAKTALRDYNPALGPLATNWTGSIGSVLMLVMVILLINQSGTLAISNLNTSTPELLAALLLVAVSLKSFGLVATTWFSGSEGESSTANALLVGLGIIVVGLYPYVRITRLILNSLQGWQDTAIWVTLAIALLFALAALKEREIYRICSFIVFGQFFALIVSFTVGNQNAMEGALLGLIGYVAGSISLFLGAGLVKQIISQRMEETRQVGDDPALIVTQPALAILFFIGAVSLVGLPPLAGFGTKALVTAGLFQRAQPYSILWIGVWLISTIAILRAFQLTFVNVPDSKIELVTPKAGFNRLALIPLGIVVAFLFSSSFWQQDILTWLQPVMMTLLG